MNERRQNSSNYPYLFFMASSADHVTGVTGAAPAVQVSKNGGAFAAAAGSVVELSFGWYSLSANPTDRNTLGGCAIHASASGCDPFDGRLTVVPWDPFDPNMSLAALPGVAAGSAGGLPTVDANNSVRLQAGTGPNQINLSGGNVSVFANGDKVGYSLTAPAPTAAQVASAVWSDTVAEDFAVAGSPGKTLLANLDASISTRSTYAGGPVASVTGSIGSVAGVSFPANFATLAINAAGSVTAGSVTDKAGYKVASDGLDAVTIESGVNARQAVSAILASSAGVLSGAATNRITIQGGNVSTTRITATVDPSGNRPSVALSLPA